VVIHNNSIDNLYTRKRKQDAQSPILTMSVNGASTIFGLVGQVINMRFGSGYT